MEDEILTHVVSDDGEWSQVGLPQVLHQGVGILLKVTQQVGCAPVSVLDLLPMVLVNRIENSTSSHDNVLPQQQRTDKTNVRITST